MSEKLGCILTNSLFVNKENSSSNIVMCLSHVYWFNEDISIILLICFHLTSDKYMYEILLEELALCRLREEALEALEKIEAREDQAWINCHKSGKSNSLPIPISFSVKAVCLQVY